MIFIIGSFFWILALLAAGRLLYAGRSEFRKHAWQWGLLGLLAIGLLFRPHEDIFGGEDPGSYLNSGVTYGRKNSLLYRDTLLAQVPVETRSAFYYGHAGYGTTKDACLWVVNTDMAMLGPRFQPAYPLLISVITRLGSNAWSLYVVPLFGLFTGLALMLLATRLLKHRLAGLLAVGCYILNPLTLWHARCARPEIIAGFMIFAGLALLLLAWQSRPWQRWWDILLGALCIGAAPFFHITAWYLAIPAAFGIGLLILQGRPDFLLYPPAALIMLMMFHVETRYATDYYHLNQVLDAFFDSWPFSALGFVVLSGISLAVNRTRLKDPVESGDNIPGAAPCFPLWLAALFALASTMFILDVFFNRDKTGLLPFLTRLIPDYNFLTDWQTFVNMVTIPIAILILIGWIAWLTGERLRRLERIWLALIVFPALVLAGSMRDFMMTRYLMLAVIPMSALCLTALATRLPEWPRRPWTAWLAPGLAAIICLAGLTNRSHLMTMVEHRGLLNFLAQYARIIQNANGILLGEYSRLTAPLEHMFGVPALGLDNERRDDYAAAEEAWAAIMRAHPDQPAFFTTPFQAPRSDRFDFELAKSYTFNGLKLQQARNALPTRILDNQIPLHLYRMRLKEETHATALLTNSLALPIANGNMGFRRLANVRVDRPALQGIALSNDEQTAFSLPGTQHSGLRELLLVIHSEEPHPAVPLAKHTGTSEHNYGLERFLPLSDRWWLFSRTLSMTPGSNTVLITAQSPVVITSAFLLDKTNVTELTGCLAGSRTGRDFEPITGRWARADASILLPAVGPCNILMLIYAPETNGSHDDKALTFRDESGWSFSTSVYPGAWQWLILPGLTERKHDLWMQLQAPAWDPGKRGFPSDLGVFIGKIIVVPSQF